MAASNQKRAGFTMRAEKFLQRLIEFHNSRHIVPVAVNLK
jgi:hypothetical protein